MPPRFVEASMDLLRLHAEVLAQQIDAAKDADAADTLIHKRLLWGIRGLAATAQTERQRRERERLGGLYGGQSEGAG